jgi:cytochrome c556
MVSKTVMGLFAAGVLSLGLSSAAMADAKASIEAREACMKANGAMMKVMVPVIKGQNAYDKAANDAAIAAVEAACGGWAGWWGEDTKPGGALKTEAKLEIWTDPKGFEAAGGAYMAALSAVKASADEASFKAAFPDLGKSCQSCHEKFRQAD